MEGSGTQGESTSVFQRCSNFIEMVSRRWPCCFNKWTFRILSCINFFLAFFVMATPFWTAEYIPDGFTFMGLWTICNHEECSTIKVAEDFLTVMRILTISSLVFCFVGLLTSWDILARRGKKTMENVICAMANFTAGVFMMSNLVFMLLSIEESVYVNFYLGCIYCFLCFLLAKISLLKIFCWVVSKKRLSTQMDTEEGTRA